MEISGVRQGFISPVVNALLLLCAHYNPLAPCTESPASLQVRPPSLPLSCLLQKVRELQGYGPEHEGGRGAVQEPDQLCGGGRHR